MKILRMKSWPTNASTVIDCAAASELQLLEVTRGEEKRSAVVIWDTLSRLAETSLIFLNDCRAVETSSSTDARLESNFRSDEATISRTNPILMLPCCCVGTSSLVSGGNSIMATNVCAQSPRSDCKEWAFFGLPRCSSIPEGFYLSKSIISRVVTTKPRIGYPNSHMRV